MINEWTQQKKKKNSEQLLRGLQHATRLDSWAADQLYRLQSWLYGYLTCGHSLSLHVQAR